MIRVLVVDESSFSRQVIARILESIPDVSVVDTATDGQDALAKVIRLSPDLITLDLEMPNMDGFTFLRWLMNHHPLPVIVVSSKEADEGVFRAMDLGALDFVVKPTAHPSMELEEIKSNLLDKVLAVPLLQQNRLREKMQFQTMKTRALLSKGVPEQKPMMIGIAASTGGPPAIHSLLKELPAEFEVPILIAQHMPRTFTHLFAERLNRVAKLTVKEASHGEILQPQHAYVAPGGVQTLIHRGTGALQVEIDPHGSETRYKPCADVLFESIAEAAQARTVAAVLTGMGNDGTEGLKRIKQRGGITIAEDERTAIIAGMPQEAIRAGVVDYVLPLPEIATALKIFCG